MICFFIILALIAGLQESAALKDIVVKFPDHVEEGDDIEITCQYDLEGYNMYSLKWYKGSQEFFRFTKNEKPQIKIFNVKNVHVNPSSSSMNKVKLLNITQGSKGIYNCEISTDSPHFITFSNYKKLEVEPPRNIHLVVPPIVRMSDSVKLSCSYNPTKYNTPLKSISWKKNGKLFYKYEPDSQINVAVEKCPGIKFSVKQMANSSEVTLPNVTTDSEDVYTCQIDYPTSTLTSSRFLLVREQTWRPVTVTIPPLVNEKENVKLKCVFDFNKDSVNRIKWFKGNRQFYSFPPDEHSNSTTSSFEGVDVEDLITDDDYRHFVSVVLLKNVTTTTAGKYRCQVSTSSGIDFDMATLAVIRIPHGDQTIVLENDYLKSGDYVQAQCISPPSYPYADITWLLNGKEVSGDLHKESEVNKPVGFPHSVWSSISHSIGFDKESHVELTCVVTIPNIYRREKSVKIEKDPSNFVTPSIYHNHVYPSMTMSAGHHSWTKASVATIIISFVLLLNW